MVDYLDPISIGSTLVISIIAWLIANTIWRGWHKPKLAIHNPETTKNPDLFNTFSVYIHIKNQGRSTAENVQTAIYLDEWEGTNHYSERILLKSRQVKQDILPGNCHRVDLGDYYLTTNVLKFNFIQQEMVKASNNGEISGKISIQGSNTALIKYRFKITAKAGEVRISILPNGQTKGSISL